MLFIESYIGYSLKKKSNFLHLAGFPFLKKHKVLLSFYMCGSRTSKTVSPKRFLSISSVILQKFDYRDRYSSVIKYGLVSNNRR